tara:strand:- start:46 stop:324 length:279 start_codon:yes stop_codon:yes gene_type:complete
MNSNVGQKKNMKLKFKLFLAFTILFTIITIVLQTINYNVSDINDNSPTDFDTIILIFVYINYLLIMCNCLICIDSKNIYDYETLTVRESASI